MEQVDAEHHADRERGAEWLGEVYQNLSEALEKPPKKCGKHMPARDSMVDLRELARLLGTDAK